MENGRTTECLYSIAILTVFFSGVALAQVIQLDEEVGKAKTFRDRSQFDSSLAHFELASRFAAAASRKDRYYECVIEIIDNYARTGQFRRADSLAELTESGVRKELGEHHALLAETYLLLGYLRSYENRSAESIGYFNRGLDIRRSFNIPNDPRVAAFQFGLGLTHVRIGNIDAAFEAFDTARAIQVRFQGEREADLANTLVMIGYTHDQNNEPSRALEKYSEASSIFLKHNLGDSPLQAACDHYRAAAYKNLGRYEESVAYERRALSITRRCFGDNSIAVGALLIQLADHFVESGDLETAQTNYSEALAITRTTMGNDHSTTHDIERKLALLYASRNEFDRALETDLRVIASHSADYGAKNPELGYLYKELAEIYKAKGDLAMASDSYDRALALRNGIRTSGERLDIAGLLRDMGSVFLARGELDSAASSLQRSLDLQNSSQLINRGLTSSTYESLALLSNARGDTEGALRMYQHSLIALCPGFNDTSVLSHPPLPQHGYGREYVKLLIEKAGAILTRGGGASAEHAYRVSALQAYDLASVALDQVRKSYRSERSKLALQEEVLPVYESGMKVAMTLYRETGNAEYKEAAFGFAERSRGAVLLEGLQEVHPTHYAGVPDRLIERENFAQRELTALENAMERSEQHADSVSTTRTRKSILEKIRDIDQVEDSLAECDARFATMYSHSRPASPADIQHALDSGTCLIEYSVCADSIFIFVVQKNSFDVATVGRPANLDTLATTLRRSLRTMDSDAFPHPARQLHALLIQPVAARLLLNKRLVIVPDGTLHYIPFEVLLAPESSSSAGETGPVVFRNLPYLLKTHEISYSVSGTLFCEDRTRSAVSGRGTPSFAGFAPVFRDSCAAIDVATLRTITIDGRRFSELPFSEDEVKNIAGAFNAKGRNGMYVINTDATEESFKSHASRYSILHVATHGTLDEQHPGMSALLFAPDKDSSSQDDGILYAGEVYGMHLCAELVVLSSCESGLGKLVRGEGLMAMTRGFLYAGARNILYSLWKIQDKHASTLMQKFYAHVLAGETFPGALRAAKLEMIRNDATAHPFKWAGYALMGE